MTDTITSPKSDSPASGKRVFISYRTQEPDKSLAQTLHKHLKAAGHEPFMAAESIAWGGKLGRSHRPGIETLRLLCAAIV